jgi:hypothetical protein
MVDNEILWNGKHCNFRWWILIVEVGRRKEK